MAYSRYEEEGNMSRYLKLLAVGILPLATGYLFNRFLFLFDIFISIKVFPVALLILWGILAFSISSAEKCPIVQSFMLCAFGLLMLVLVLYQELVLGHYWPNTIGVFSQSFFTPFLSLGMWVTLFLPVSRIWPAYIATWLCIFAASCVGCIQKTRKLR